MASTTQSRDLHHSYRWCRKLCQNSGSSFFRSFSLLDRSRREAMYTLYAFARISDDLSDGCADEAAASNSSLKHLSKTRAATLDAWRAQLKNIASNSLATDQAALYPELWPALLDSMHRFAIPVDLLEDIVVGVQMDLDHQQPQDWDELHDYCYHVASAVGLACTQIWRASDYIPREAAIDCGKAFQITNILRDVAEDAERGRIYLPASLLGKHDVSTSGWRACKPTGQWISAIEEAAAHAIDLYDRGWSTIDALTPKSQRMFSLMWRSYRGLLDEVVAHPQRLWQRPKPRVPLAQRVRLVASHFILPLYSRLPSP